MESVVIEIKHLKKAFGGNEVLSDISLQVKKGENLAILGKSGCGKSVLIKCIVGLLEPDEGSLEVFGKNIDTLNEDGLNETRKRIGFLFQSAALYDSLTVRENLEFPMRNMPKKPKDEMDEIVHEALRNVDLEKAIDKMPSELSGGMRKRIGLARSLIMNPEIMLYDEPTTGLDPITSREISQLMLEVQKKYKTTSVIITHDMECAHITSNRMAIINEGRFIIEGTSAEVTKSKDKYVTAFFK
jgi:phospholipid/cholesterol/gamma-HCH transport system ATP-binding protein